MKELYHGGPCIPYTLREHGFPLINSCYMNLTENICAKLWENMPGVRGYEFRGERSNA